jgi:type IX secretion system PorP/SprF family membrane protein
MKNKITIITLVLLVAIAGKSAAQVDPHFSQYYADPLWLNPALTGVINGDSRISSNYKNQWADINNAYETVAISADYRATNKVGLGLSILDQTAGDHSYNYLSAYGSLSYGITLSNDGNQRLNFGVQAGIINRSFDQSKLQFGDQYNPTSGFDPGASSFENFPTTNSTVFDANAGIFYYDGNPLSSVNPFAGVSVGHLSGPKDAFSPDGQGKIPIRYTVHGGLRIKMADWFDLVPNALYIRQQDADIKAVGAYSEFKTQNDNSFIFGVLERFNDATSIDVGYHVNSLIIGTSYDINTSSLSRATNGRGGIELSLSYVFHKHIQEPEPVCPRL